MCKTFRFFSDRQFCHKQVFVLIIWRAFLRNLRSRFLIVGQTPMIRIKYALPLLAQLLKCLSVADSIYCGAKMPASASVQYNCQRSLHLWDELLYGFFCSFDCSFVAGCLYLEYATLVSSKSCCNLFLYVVCLSDLSACYLAVKDMCHLVHAIVTTTKLNSLQNYRMSIRSSGQAQLQSPRFARPNLNLYTTHICSSTMVAIRAWFLLWI